MPTNPQTPKPAPREHDWPATFDEVNAWRGACVHHFAAVEFAVTETLLTLSSIAGRDKTVRLRQLIGQRFEDLAEALGPDGPFAKEGVAAQAALAQFRAEHEAFRGLLCHGALKITVDQNGHWTAIARSLSIRSRQAERRTEVLEQAEARDKLASLKRDGQQLASVLGQLRKGLTG